MTNRKLHTRFRLVPKSTTLDDLEGPLRTVFQNTAHHENLNGIAKVRLSVIADDLKPMRSCISGGHKEHFESHLNAKNVKSIDWFLAHYSDGRYSDGR